MTHRIGRLAVWGDSIAKGIVQGREGRSYALYRNHSLQRAAERLNGALINRSSFGCTVGKGKKVLRRDLAANLKCDAAIIAFGGNDCDFNWPEVGRNPEAHHQPRTPLPQFRSDLAEIVHTLRERGIKPALVTLPPLVPERFFLTITRGLDPRAILRWIGDVHMLYRWHEMYSAAITRCALETNCCLIDVRSAFLAEHDYQRLICDDGIHPNEEGHRVMESVFVAAGEQAILERAEVGNPRVDGALAEPAAIC